MSSQSVQNLTRGIIRENPTFVMLLGMCPTLGVTTSAGNGLGMGLATLFVLILSNSAISLVKNLIPAMVRIPCYIVIIASFVTVVDLLMAAAGHIHTPDCRQLYHSRPRRSLCRQKQSVSVRS